MHTILICDDEKDIVNALKIYLTNDEYQLFSAYNGEEALKVIRENDIHLVLLDIMMPVMDGMSAMEAIRQEYNMPIILISAKSEDVDKILGLNMGADDYITKPFNPVEIQARVHSHLRRYTKRIAILILHKNAFYGISVLEPEKEFPRTVLCIFLNVQSLQRPHISS